MRGRVQGVGFRYNCGMVANSLGVAGWITNRDDGAVEIHAEGAPDAVADLADWCRQGPRHARVTRVDVRGAKLNGYGTFSAMH